MAVRRKVFRIEESARAGATDGVVADAADISLHHRQLMSELQSLRAPMEPRAGIERDSMERARAQLAEAQAYKHELGLVYAAVERTRGEMGAAGADAFGGASTARVSRELQAIVAGADRATQSILQAAEEIEQAANTLSAALKSAHDQGLANDIQDRVLQIFEACNFHDLTGQRVANVVAALNFVEEHVARVLEIWQGIEQFKPIVLDADSGGDRRYLNGPKLPGDRGHSTQDDIDELFGRA